MRRIAGRPQRLVVQRYVCGCLVPAAVVQVILFCTINAWSHRLFFYLSTLLFDRYIKKPLLLDGLKFDLRLYVLVTQLKPLEVSICNEGMARFCTQDYKQPTKDNLKNLYMHLTNYSLNKNSDGYKAPPD